MDILKIIYFVLDVVLIGCLIFFVKKGEKNYKNVDKGIIRQHYYYYAFGISGIICIPYSMIGIFLFVGFNLATIIINCTAFYVLILSIFSFIYAKTYCIEYSKDFFIIKKFKKQVRYNCDEVDFVLKPTYFKVYDNGKKICTISFLLQTNAYDFLKKIANPSKNK